MDFEDLESIEAIPLTFLGINTDYLGLAISTLSIILAIVSCYLGCRRKSGQKENTLDTLSKLMIHEKMAQKLWIEPAPKAVEEEIQLIQEATATATHAIATQTIAKQGRIAKIY